MCSSHKDCPFNKKIKDNAPQHNGDTESVNSDVSTSILSDTKAVSSEGSTALPDSDWCFEDDIISGDLCYTLTEMGQDQSYGVCLYKHPFTMYKINSLEK